VVEDNLESLLAAVREGRVPLAAAGLTATPERKGRMAFGPVYGEVREWVVCNPNGRMPKDLGDMKDLRLEVVLGSSHADQLRKLAKSHPDMEWVEVKAPGSEDIFERVELGLSDCTIADSDSLAVAHNFHPGLKDAFVLHFSVR